MHATNPYQALSIQFMFGMVAVQVLGSDNHKSSVTLPSSSSNDVPCTTSSRTSLILS